MQGVKFGHGSTELPIVLKGLTISNLFGEFGDFQLQVHSHLCYDILKLNYIAKLYRKNILMVINRRVNANFQNSSLLPF